MIDKNNKNVILKIIGLAVAVFLLILIVNWLIGPTDTDGDSAGNNNLPGDREKAIDSLDSVIKEIDVKTVPHTMDPNIPLPSELIDTLPDISKYPIQVNSGTDSYIEIFSSTEKAGSGTDGWLTEVAKDFNNAKVMIDGKQVSVRLRGIASGKAADYIASGKYPPDAYTPSNELWGEMIISRGVKAELVEKRLAGNVAGVLLSRVQERRADEQIRGNQYHDDCRCRGKQRTEFLATPDPFESSTGLNFLI